MGPIECARLRDARARPRRSGCCAAPRLARPAPPRWATPRSRHPIATSGRGTPSPSPAASSGAAAGRFAIAPHRRARSTGSATTSARARPSSSASGVARGELERLIVDPFVELANRITGPVDQTVTFAEVNVQFNVTGGKTLAPPRAVRRVRSRASPFRAARPPTPAASSWGTRSTSPRSPASASSSPTGSHLRAEARAVFWKLKYPTSFEDEPVLEPGTAESPNAVITDGRVSEWVASPWLQAGSATPSRSDRCRCRCRAPSAFAPCTGFYRPDWTEARNREAFGPLSRGAWPPARLSLRGDRQRPDRGRRAAW